MPTLGSFLCPTSWKGKEVVCPLSCLQCILTACRTDPLFYPLGLPLRWCKRDQLLRPNGSEKIGLWFHAKKCTTLPSRALMGSERRYKVTPNFQSEAEDNPPDCVKSLSIRRGSKRVKLCVNSTSDIMPATCTGSLHCINTWTSKSTILDSSSTCSDSYMYLSYVCLQCPFSSNLPLSRKDKRWHTSS